MRRPPLTHTREWALVAHPGSGTTAGVACERTIAQGIRTGRQLLAYEQAVYLQTVLRVRPPRRSRTGSTERRVRVLMWLRRHRSIGGALASVLLAFVLTVQSGVVCPDGTHAGGHGHHHGAAMAMHHHPPQAPVDAARIPLCCWALANCTSPAVPAARGAADSDAVRTRETPVFAAVTPRPLAFAPETPPPRV